MVSIGFEPWTAGRKALTDPLGKIYLFVLKIGPFITTKFLIQLIENKISWWMDSNCGSLVSEATALPTEPQPLHINQHFCIFLILKNARNVMTEKGILSTGRKSKKQNKERKRKGVSSVVDDDDGGILTTWWPPRKCWQDGLRDDNGFSPILLIYIRRHTHPHILAAIVWPTNSICDIVPTSNYAPTTVLTWWPYLWSGQSYKPFTIIQIY